MENGNGYDNQYWLMDGIYPCLATFVLGFAKPVSEKDCNFTYWQELICKDIERAFGVLQARWKVLSLPACHWEHSILDDMVRCCVILHNMIIEDEYENPDIDNDNVEFNNLDGTIVLPAYKIQVDDSITDLRQSVFAEVLQKSQTES